MSAKRGDAELASVMRKLLRSEAFLSVDSHGPTRLTIDDTSVEITEDEAQAIEEATWAR